MTGPLGLAGTGYRPAPALIARVAATEWKPERGLDGCVRGQVHDETAFGLGGVAGHAGLFAPAADLLRFGECLRLGGGPVLSAETTAEMLRDQGAKDAPFRHGLGVRIGDPGIVGPLTGAFGHSGFTGTSLVVDPAHRLTVVLLTNAVHPVRGREGIRPCATPSPPRPCASPAEHPRPDIATPDIAPPGIAPPAGPPPCGGPAGASAI
ncbi:serine hydrolase [Nonomuraea sp. NBC_01738]|nr:serine hydrolase [Nonomuraea sp. NBC_01738]